MRVTADPCTPSLGELELAKLADLNRVVTIRGPRFGSATLAAGATKIFCSFNPGNGMEGLVMGLAFYAEPEDYQTSPVSLVVVGGDALAANADTPGEAIEVFTGPLTRDVTTPFYYPTPFGRYFEPGQAVGLQWTNREASGTYYVSGSLIVATWAVSARMQVLAKIARMGPAFGGERLF